MSKSIRRGRAPLGVILYNGPSAITGQPIVVIANGFRRRSKNSKTGDMIQTWILDRDVNPVKAINSGRDRSVCGSCPLRGIIALQQKKRKRRIRADYIRVNRLRGCYVKVDRAPLSVWKAFHRGSYEQYDSARHDHLFRGRLLRIGSYGDPAAAPYSVWSRVIKLVDGHAGYTHQWRDGRNWRFRRIVMASCESLPDAELARANGWRTFRTLQPGQLPVVREFSCPASEEQGHRLTCAQCGACDGAQRNPLRASVVIQAHGSKGTLSSFRQVTVTTN